MRHCIALLWVGLLVAGPAWGQPQAPEPALDKETQAAVRALQEKRRDLLREALEARVKLYQTARAPLGEVIATARQLLAAELDLAGTPAERVAAHERLYERAQAWVEVAKVRHAAARGVLAEVQEAQALSLEAAIGLLKAGGKPKPAEK